MRERRNKRGYDALVRGKLQVHGLYADNGIYFRSTIYFGYGNYAALMIVPRFDKLLAKKNRSFYWLAKETGVSHTTLWRLKKGKALGINFETLEKICRALRCQPGDVLFLTDEKASPRRQPLKPRRKH